MHEFDLSQAAWRKSSRSNGAGGNCVEVAGVDAVVAVRDSKDPEGPVLVMSRRAWGAFVRASVREA
ncbi:DUF397 domain-containing protein [Actinomadura fibrosa]|uniref:DUF397 domain-containing protein n=1 Tax=Actinomadura fibrosa TaxID=111802 RepID=A0ABW2XUB3_9ACTN